ncbi:hypothetical protein FACS189429_3580 [Bacteroidia bacterium]|nr:hypothetical protein FACS189429_3580 [Bacteroidia bacterium]
MDFPNEKILGLNKVTQIGDAVYYNRREVLGLTDWRGTASGKNLGSDVYLYKNAFTNKYKLYATIGHEYVHVNLYHNGISDSTIQEAIAYDWTFDQLKSWKIDYGDWFNQYYKIYKTIDISKQGHLPIISTPPIYR